MELNGRKGSCTIIYSKTILCIKPHIRLYNMHCRINDIGIKQDKAYNYSYK